MKRLFALIFLIPAMGTALAASRILTDRQLRKTAALSVVFTELCEDGCKGHIVAATITPEEARQLSAFLHREVRSIGSHELEKRKKGISYMELVLQKLSPTRATLLGGWIVANLGDIDYLYTLRYSKGRWHIHSKHQYAIS